MDQLGILLLVVGFLLIVVAGVLTALNRTRSLVNLFVPSGLRMNNEGFFATKVGVEMVMLVGAILIIAGTVAAV